MKQLLIINLLLTLWIGPINSEWRRGENFTDPPFTGGIHELYFTDSLNGWSVAGGRYIAKTSDGGLTWINLPPPPVAPVNFYAVYAEENKVWVAGGGIYFPGPGIILYSSDKGETWVEHTNPDSNNVLFVIRRVGNKIWIAGGNNEPWWRGLLLESADDSGASGVWIKHDLSQYGGIWNIDILDSNVWLSCSRGNIIKTTDQGNNWIDCSIDDTLLALYKIIPQNDQLYVVGSRRFEISTNLYVSTDNGNNWIPRHTNDSVEVVGFGSDIRNFYITGSVLPGIAIILQSSDKGFTWTKSWKDTAYGGLYSNLFQLDINHMWVAHPYYCLYYVPDTLQSPSSPSLVYPPNGISGLPHEVMVKWHSVDGATSYRCQLADDSSFIRPFTNTIDSSTVDTFLILTLDSGLHYWRVYAKNEVGYSNASEIWSFSSTGPVEVVDNCIPNTISLSQNYPNPFNPITTITYTIPSATYVRLIIYDIKGVEIIRLVDGNKEIGKHQIVFDATNLASGIYYAKLQADKTVILKKMIFIK